MQFRQECRFDELRCRNAVLTRVQHALGFSRPPTLPTHSFCNNRFPPARPPFLAVTLIASPPALTERKARAARPPALIIRPPNKVLIFHFFSVFFVEANQNSIKKLKLDQKTKKRQLSLSSASFVKC